MAWNSDDGTRYRTNDGRVFNTEKDAEDHYKQQAENAAAAEAHAKYLAWVKEVLDQAWGLINKGDNKGAVDFINNHKCQSSQLAYPLGMAYENLGDNQSAAHFYSEFLQKYIASNNVNEENSNNNVLYSRARVYIKLGDWRNAKSDCTSVMDSDSYGNDRNDVMSNAIYWRGLCFENLGSTKRAIFDYKTASDFGSAISLQKLNSFRINYKPKKPPGSFLGNLFLGIILGALSTAGYMLLMAILQTSDKIDGGGILPVLIMFSIGIVICIIWVSSKYKVYPVLKRIIALVLLTFIIGTGVGTLAFFQKKLNDFEVGSIAIVATSGWYSDPEADSYDMDIPRDSEVLVTGSPVKASDGRYYVQIEYNGVTGYLTPSNLRKKK